MRDNYHCISCMSTPRERALIKVVTELYPEYKFLSIHESSPGNPSSDKIKRECKTYTFSQYFSDIICGDYKEGVRCEDLQKLRFRDNMFDIFITQDVFEHIIEPEKAFKEVERVLKPGGVHIFTVPYYYWKRTLVRAKMIENHLEYLEPIEYHGSPISDKGTLVVTEWGYDLIPFIEGCTNMKTKVYTFNDTKENYKLGLDADFLEVFVSTKCDR